MVCDTKSNALKFLQEKGVIGKYNDIINPKEFEKLNKELTRYSELIYDLDFKENLLFTNYTSETVHPRTSTYLRNDTAVTIWAKPNNELFSAIDVEILRSEAREASGNLEIQNIPDSEFPNEISDPFFKRGKFEANEVNKLFQDKLKSKLVTFLGGLNVTTDLSADKLLEGIHYKKGSPLAAFDLIQKFLALKSDVSNKDLLNQSAHVIYAFLGRGSKISKDLWFNIENWNKYDETYEKWNEISKNNLDDDLFKREIDYQLMVIEEDFNEDDNDYYKNNPNKNWWAHRQAIIELMSEMLEVGIDNKYIGNKRSNPDINKEYFENLGYKDKFAANWLTRIFNKIYNWIQKNIFQNKAFEKFNSIALEDLVLDVVDDVYQLKYEKFIRNYVLSEEDGNWYDMKGQLYEVKDYEKSIEADPFVKDIIEKLFGNPFIDYALSGSATLRKFGRVLRSVDEAFHDVDGVIKLSQFQKEENGLQFLNWINERGIPLSQRYGVSQSKQQRNFKKFTKEITPLLEGQGWYANVQNMFPTWKILRTFIGRQDLKTGESIVITGTIEHPTETELVTQDNLNGRSPKDIGKTKPKLFLLDFFLRTKEGSYPMQYEGYEQWYKEWKQIFEAKLLMGRAKDINDLIYFIPVKKDQEGYQFRNRGFRYFSFTNENQSDLTIDITDPFKDEVSLITADNSKPGIIEKTVYKNDKVVGKIQYKISADYVDVLEVDTNNVNNSISALKMLGIESGNVDKILRNVLSKYQSLFKTLEIDGFSVRKNNTDYFIDPQTAAAIKNIVVEVPINTKSQKKIRGIEIAKTLAQKLSLSLNVGYANVSQADAKKLLNTTRKKYNNEPAFYFAGTVYTVGDNVNLDTVLHEFAHPFIKAIEINNPELFKNLYAQLGTSTEGAYIKNHVKINYPEYKVDSSDFMNEALSYSMQYHAVNQTTEEIESIGFIAFIQKLLYAIRQLFRKVYSTSKVKDINVDTTIEELANKLLNENYDFASEFVSDEDVLFFARNIKEMANELTEGVNEGNIQRGINEMYVTNNLVLNKAKHYTSQSPYYQEMLKKTLFEDGPNIKLSPKIQEMLRSYQTVSDYKHASKDEIIQDVVRREKERQQDLANKSRAFVNTVTVVDNIAKNMYKDLDALRKTKSFKTRDAIVLLYTYRNSINAYSNMFADFDAFFTEEQEDGKPKFNIDKENDLFKLMSGVEKNLKRANDIIKDIYKENSIDFFVEVTSYMNDFLKDRLNQDLVKVMSEKMKPQEIEDFFLKAVDGKLKEEDYEALKKKGVQPKYISEFVKTYEKFNVNKEKIVDALSGRLKDVGWLNRFAEAYTSSNDPIVGGLAIFIQNIRTEAEQEAIAESYEFRNKMAELLPKVGYNRLKTRQILDMIATTDTVFSLTAVKDKSGNVLRLEPSQKEVYTFHDKFGNGWRHDLGKLEYELTIAAEEEDQDAIDKAQQALYEFTKQFMHDVYIPEVYELDKIYDKYPPEIADAARQARKRALDAYNAEANEITDELERYQKYSTLQVLWKEYRQLHSMTYKDGTAKVDSPADGVYDLSIAKILNEYREASRGYYEFSERKGSLQTSYDQFINLIDTKHGSTSQEFIDAKNDWLRQNTRVAHVQKYYDTKTELITRLKELQAKMKKDDSKVDVAALFEEMYGLMYSSKDSLNQPVPEELGEEVIKKIKNIQQKIIDYKASLNKTSGLTNEESTKLAALVTLSKNNPTALTEADQEDYMLLLQKQTATGLSLAEANELESIYGDLGQLTKKQATEYYIDIFNSHLQRMGKDVITKEDVDDFIDTKGLQDLLIDDDEFSDWFFDNHVIYAKYVKGKKGLHNFYQRSAANNITLPQDEDYYQTTELIDPLTKETFTLKINDIPVVANARHSNYRLKKEYMTGYNSETGNVELIIGEHVNNKKEFLPRYVEGSPYINKEYERMQKAPSTARYKLLQAMKDAHLKSQEKSPSLSKLYLDLPRYILRDNLSVIQSGKAGNQAMQIKENLMQGIRDAGFGSKNGVKDKSMEDYNYVYDDVLQEYRLVSTTLEGEEIQKIPVSGLFDIEINKVDPDVLQNMMRYMYSLKQQEKLVETLPLVSSILETLEDPENMLKKKNIFSRGVFKTAGKLKEVVETGKYNRLEQVRSLMEREYFGRKFEGRMEGLDRFFAKVQKLSARSSLAINIPSDLKNRFGQLMQNYIQVAGGADITVKDYAKGRIKAAKVMTQWVAKDVYSIGAGSLNYQLIEAFDSVFATKDKFGRTISRSFAKDLLNGEWMYMARKNLEMEAALQLYFAFMENVLVEQKLKNGKTRKISYIDAWEVDPKTKIMRLKDGIDPEYNNRKVEHVFAEGESLQEIADTYNTTVERLQKLNGIKSEIQLTDNQTITIANSAKFKLKRNKFQGMSRRLYGAYDEFGQAEGNKYVGYRLFTFMRKWFIPLYINRWGMTYDSTVGKNIFSAERYQGRYDWALGQTPIGFYINGYKALIKSLQIKSQGYKYLSAQEKIDVFRMAFEGLTIIALGLIATFMFGYDPDDPDRFKKMRERSSIIGSEDFDTIGYLTNLSEILTLGTMQEVTAFIPMMQIGVFNFGLDDMLKIASSTTSAFSNTLALYAKIIDDLIKLSTGNEKAYYQKGYGEVWYKQSGEPKVYNHLFKAVGVSGSTADLPTTLKGIEAAGKLR